MLNRNNTRREGKPDLMDTDRVGTFLLATSGIVGLALIHPFLLVIPAVLGVVLLFVGASDMPTDSPTGDAGR